MTALLLALFGGAGLLAVGCLVMTIRCYAAAALAIGRELEAGVSPKCPPPTKSPIYRRKARLTWRVATRRGPGARDLRRDRSIAEQRSAGLRKSDHRRQFSESFGMRPGTPLPGTLVFE